MAQQGLAVHESMELHELLMFKSTCMTKSNTMQQLATDDGLKSLMQQDVEQSSKAINQLKSILERAKTQ